MLALGLLVIGLTLILTLAMCRIRERKHQALTTLALFGVVILILSLPGLMRGGIPDAYYGVLTYAGLFIVPLAIILPGTLGFWPETRKSIVRRTLCCSVFTLIISVLIYTAIVLGIPRPTFVSSIQQVLTVLLNLPGGFQLGQLAVFLIFTLLSATGYWIIGTLLHRASPVP
jgi:hypothetical protein